MFSLFASSHIGRVALIVVRLCTNCLLSFFVSIVPVVVRGFLSCHFFFPTVSSGALFEVPKKSLRAAEWARVGLLVFFFFFF